MRKRKMYLSVEDIAELFGLSVSFAYRVVERMNADLASKNYYVILGRVPTRYVEDKIYGLEHVEQYLKEDKAIVQEKMYMDVDDVCAILGVSKAYAYNLMREYNKELKAKGYIVVAGKISTKFLAEKIYGMKVED